MTVFVPTKAREFIKQFAGARARRYGSAVVLSVLFGISGVWVCMHRNLRQISEGYCATTPRTNYGSTTRDCGASSLYVVCRLAGKSPSLDSLREVSKTTERGCTMLDLKMAAVSVGFDVTAVKMHLDALRSYLSHPQHYAILHIPRGHFIAAVGTGGADSIRIVDPAKCVRDVDGHILVTEYGWEGHALLLSGILNKQVEVP